jgi:1-deoxy-D-xylulose-5-phosphate reductoisomerase
MRYISGLPKCDDAEGGPRVLSLLGSTGSIGRSVLDVVRLQPQRFRIAALAGGRNMELLAAQAGEFRPDRLGALDEESADRLRRLLPRGIRPDVLVGRAGYEELARSAQAGMVVSAQTGAAGLHATYAAARSGKIIALANKESLVLAGRLIREACAGSGACVLPVDSEHNAVFQCLAGNGTRCFSTDGRGGLRRLILTASGGPFRDWTKEDMDKAGPAQALRHPNWNMGARVSIDSATLMNKGLELIEAHHLFGLPMEDLEVTVHRESVVHSLAEFTDGSLLAQLGAPDMRIPIAYCLGFPERLRSGAPALSLNALGALHFSPPDRLAFPCLDLARRAQASGKGCPVVLNAANEEAVEAFLADRIPFGAVPRIVKRCLDEHEEGMMKRSASAPAGGVDAGPNAARDDSPDEPDTLEAVLALDADARVRARRAVEYFSGPAPARRSGITPP